MPELPQNESIDTAPSWLSAAGRFVVELAEVVVISLAIILPIRYFLIQPFYVKGASMEPTFDDREYLIIDEISYRFREVDRGEVVVFRYPQDPRQFFIKRIIAAAGSADKDRTASLIPITQQTGFALGAALSGLIANSLGLNQEPTAQEIKLIAFWLFAGFVPLAFLGNIMAWRFVGQSK